MTLQMKIAGILGCFSFGGWAIWAAMGNSSWYHWYSSGLPAAICMGILGYWIGNILSHPDSKRRHRKKKKRHSPAHPHNPAPPLSLPLE